MNQERKDLAALFARLHAVGIESAKVTPCIGREVPDERQVLQVLGEMMVMPHGDITTDDVLTAAKRAGAY